MISLQVPNYILYNKALSSNDKLIYSLMVAYNSQQVIMSNGRIAKELGLSRETVKRSLLHLEQLELIQINNDASLNGSYKSRKITLLCADHELVKRLLDLRKPSL